MKKRDLQRPFLRVRIGDCPHGDSAHEVLVWRAWWAGIGQGGTQRELHRFCIPTQDGPESERMARCLEAAAAALRG